MSFFLNKVKGHETKKTPNTTKPKTNQTSHFPSVVLYNNSGRFKAFFLQKALYGLADNTTHSTLLQLQAPKPAQGTRTFLLVSVSKASAATTVRSDFQGEGLEILLKAKGH